MVAVSYGFISFFNQCYDGINWKLLHVVQPFYCGRKLRKCVPRAVMLRGLVSRFILLVQLSYGGRKLRNDVNGAAVLRYRLQLKKISLCFVLMCTMYMSNDSGVLRLRH